MLPRHWKALGVVTQAGSPYHITTVEGAGMQQAGHSARAEESRRKTLKAAVSLAALEQPLNFTFPTAPRVYPQWTGVHFHHGSLFKAGVSCPTMLWYSNLIRCLLLLFFVDEKKGPEDLSLEHVLT